MQDTVIFHLARFAPLTPIRPYPHCVKILYEEIRLGNKTSEWRELGKRGYWLRRLCMKGLSINLNATEKLDLTLQLKVRKAWFVQGYPKNNLPRIEADITGLVYHPETLQLEIQFKVVREVMTLAMKKAREDNQELGKILETHRRQNTALIFTVPKIGETET